MKKLIAVLAISVAVASISPAFARNGADDPAGDDRGGKGRGKDDGAGHALIDNGSILIFAKNGADDPAGDDRGGKGGKGGGKDDAPNHG